MKALVRPALVTAIALFTLQCQDQKSPVAVDDSANLTISATQAEIEAMIADLFPTGLETAAIKRFRTAVRHLDNGRTDLAQKTILELIRWQLQRKSLGQHEDPNGGDPPTLNEAFADLFNAELEFFGLLGDPIPAGVFGPDGGFGPCGPDGCLIVSETKCAGVSVGEGALDETVFIYFYRLPDSPGPLNTVLPQFPYFIFYGSSPEVEEFNVPVDVALWVLDNPPFALGATSDADLALAHNVGEGIEILPPGNAGFIQCADPTTTAFRAPMWERFAAGILRPFSPSLLYAMPGELGGKASNFSPFGAVDISESEPEETTTTLDAEPNSVAAFDPVTLTATVSPPPLTAEDPQVEFFEDGESPTSLGIAAVNSDGVAVLELTTACFVCEASNCLLPGTHTIVAEFLGTDSFAPSPSNEEVVDVSGFLCIE